MRSNGTGAAMVAALVVLAGCAGGIPGSGESPIETPAETPGPVADTGTVNLYVSDEPNAIGDFEHLNVTISSVGFQRAGGGSDDAENASDGTGNGSDAGENGGWMERDVDDRSVDLTALRGANATLLAEFDVPRGEYTKVFAHVDEVNATLTNGERTTVKLPSEKLQLNKPFAVGQNESVDFVFDIAVHEAGKSGKYVLKPVIGESGTDVPIDRVDGDDREENRVEAEDDGLRAAFLDDVSPGENVTVEVTRNGSAVENATVFVDDEPVGETDAEGRITLDVPDGAAEFDVAVADDEDEAELEVEFEEDDEDDEDDDVALGAEFVGQVEAGETVTVKVDRDGTPVQNATVVVDGETVGTTDESGRLEFEAPEEEFEVSVEYGDDEAELEVEFENGNGNGDRGN